MYRARVDEEEDEEDAHPTPWQTDWEQNANAWDSDEKDQLVKPEDSASNVDSQMSASRSAGAHTFHQTQSPPAAAISAQSVGNFHEQLGERAKQRHAQLGQFSDTLERVHMKAPDIAYAHRYSASAARAPLQDKRRASQHRKEAPYANGAWDQETNRSGDGNQWSQWGSLAAPAPSEAGNSRIAYKSSKKETISKKGKERKPTDAWAGTSRDPWGGGDVWAQEEKAWGANAKTAGPPNQGKQKEANGWNANGWGSADGDPWANPAPAMDQSTSWGAWDHTEEGEASRTEEKKPKGIGRLFGKLFRRKSKVKSEKHVQIQENKPKRSKSKMLKKKKDSDSDKTAWPSPEELEDSERQQEWDEMEEDEVEGWGAGANGGWENGQNTDWGKAAESGWGGWKKDTNANAMLGKEPSGGSASGAWGAETSLWDNAPQPVQSRTHTYAARGSSFEKKREKAPPSRNYQCIDANGETTIPARMALYSRQRLARDRIFWAFNPKQDGRVSMMLDWIEQMKTDIAIYGFRKFLQSRERGALFTNVEYRPISHPSEPGFDWITYDQIQQTFDRTLQESLAVYDPREQVLAFIFLLSPSKRSMAIWRRKLPVPDYIQRESRRELEIIMDGLRPENYEVFIDEELPVSITPRQSTPAKNKRKFARFAPF